MYLKLNSVKTKLKYNFNIYQFNILIKIINKQFIIIKNNLTLIYVKIKT